MTLSAQDRKYLLMARVVIVLSSLLILLLVYRITAILVAPDDDDAAAGVMGDKKNTEMWRSSRHKLNMADLVMWGHGGSGVKEDLARVDAEYRRVALTGYARYGLNEYISARISLRRPLPDMRDAQCRHAAGGAGSNLNLLPPASVIVVFQHEARSVLLRAIFSVRDRTPPSLLKEIILVDRGTQTPALRHPRLEHYVSAISDKVKVIRSQSTLAYGQAANLGAESATGSVIVFLSARAECTTGWLTPLITWVSENPFSAAVPVVDTIDGDTFQYIRTPTSDVRVGSFSWDLTVKRTRLSEFLHPHIPRQPATLTSQVTPVIADGMFATRRDVFLSLEGYTGLLTGVDISNIEFSFRAWMCGRRIDIIPCSRVGLVRLSSGYLEPDSLTERATVAHWWMGEFQTLTHERLGTSAEKLREFRLSAKRDHSDSNHNHPQRHLYCHDFRWLLHTVEPAKLIVGHVRGSGHLVQGANLSLAVTKDHRVLGIKQPPSQIAHRHKNGPGRPPDPTNILRPEFWYLLNNGLLRTEDDWCLFSQEKPRPSQTSSSDAGNQDLHFRSDGEEHAHTRHTRSFGPEPDRPPSFQREGGADFGFREEFVLSSGRGRKGAGEGGRRDGGGEGGDVTAFRVGDGGEPGKKDGRPESVLKVDRCDTVLPRAQWIVTEESWLLNVPTEQCLESRALNDRKYALRLRPCDESKESQRWRFSHTDPLETTELPYWTY